MFTVAKDIYCAFAAAILLPVTIGCTYCRPPVQGSAGDKSRAISLNFENVRIGQLPSGFAISQTNGGELPKWSVQADPSAASGRKVLAQLSADTTKARYPLCIYEKLEARDLDVSVRYKAISGKVDQAAGIVVRLQDKDNYYITRANAIEDNFRFYKVQGGKRTQLATVQLQTTSNQWHTLRLKATGNYFEVYHDNRKMLDVQDDTFPQPGKVGLWTKADSITYFDDLKIAVLD